MFLVLWSGEDFVNCMKIKMMGKTKLFITDHADPSVGMFVQNWEVVCPFEYSEEESEMIEFFRNAMIEAYSEFANGKITALYDIEIAKESEYER